MQGTLGTFTKQPREHLYYTIDYTKWLEPSELLSNFTAQVWLDDEEVIHEVGDEHLYVLSSFIGGGSMDIKLLVAGGIHGLEYKLSVLAITSLSQQVERELIFSVEDV